MNSTSDNPVFCQYEKCLGLPFLTLSRKLLFQSKQAFQIFCTFRISQRKLGGFRVIDLVENVKSEKFQGIHHFISMNNFCYLRQKRNMALDHSSMLNPGHQQVEGPRNTSLTWLLSVIVLLILVSLLQKITILFSSLVYSLLLLLLRIVSPLFHRTFGAIECHFLMF